MVVAFAMTIAAVWLHFLAYESGGPLWRDEINSLRVSTLPSLGDVWTNLQYDSFPVLWLALLRLLSIIFGVMNDSAFRAAGLLTGLLILGALWFNAKVFRYRCPLISLSFFALNPNVVRWGDSTRAYGLGIAAILITCALIWRFTTRGDRQTFFAATLSAVISVHTLYYNATGLLALCAGAVTVCMINRSYRRAFSVILVGVISALSLLIYLPTVRAASTWNSTVRIPNYDLPWFALKLNEAISPAGTWATSIWFGAFVLALWAGSREGIRPRRLALSLPARDATVFGVATLATAAVSQFIFLKELSYLTQPWYYLVLLALSAVCMDIIAGQLLIVPTARLLRLVTVSVFAFASFWHAANLVRTRMTNVDIVAREIESRAQPGDFVVVTPWYFGVSFGRYYRGAAKWTMLPPISFDRFHRYDLLQSFMQYADQSAPAAEVIDGARQSLQSGHKVFLVGTSEGMPLRQSIVLPPALLPQEGWKSPIYQKQWASMLMEYVRSHAVTKSALRLGDQQLISDYERAQVVVASGWRE